MKDRYAKRYSRQLLLTVIGESGQKALSKASVLVVGAGATGSAIANLLARMGVGMLHIVDRDLVEAHNLHRQCLFDEKDIGKPKALAAEEKLKAINSGIEITAEVKDVNFSNVERLVRGRDVVMDGTDNIETRFLINDACVKNSIPWVYSGATATYGMSMNILPGGPCFRCLIAHVPKAGSIPTCDTIGVIPTIPAGIGAISCTEAVKTIMGREDVSRNLILYDIWDQTYYSIKVQKREECDCCGKRKFEFLSVRRRSIVTSLCGKNSVQITPIEKGTLSFNSLEKKLRTWGRVKKTEFTLTLTIPKYRVIIFRDGRTLIEGTSDEKTAKTLYSRFVGG